MNSPSETKKRGFHGGCHKWTPTDVNKFFDARNRYGNGPTSNKKIAKYIGNGSLKVVHLLSTTGVHPNHVCHFKKKLKRFGIDEIFAYCLQSEEDLAT